MESTDSRALIRSVVVCVLLVCARTASAQQPAPQAARSPVYVGVSLGLQHNTAAAEPCVPPGNRGIFCGDATGTSPGVVGMLGVFITHQFALEISGSLAQSHTGHSSYDGLSHTDSDITTGTYEHADRSMSAQLRLRAGSAVGASFEPVIGVVLMHATDSLAQQNRVITTSGNPTHTLSRPDSSTSRSAAGFLIGADIVSPASHGVSIVGSFRLRWIGWPERTNSSYNPSPEQVVPAAAGRQSMTIGVGVRFGGHR